MVVKVEDLKPGQIYEWFDTQTCSQVEEYKITIVGYDSRTQQWVGSCEKWALELSYLDEEDLEVMKLVQDVQEIRHWTTY